MFVAHAADFTCRPEISTDTAFIYSLFVACSPLAGLLPVALLTQQAEAQRAAFRSAFPNAMWRIIARAGIPVARIGIDWEAPEAIIGVDIAVLPQERACGPALAMLRTWVRVADELCRPATLSVLRDNPAARIYARLGFHATADDDGFGPVMRMRRLPLSLRR